jgi:hypothetical protein
MDTIQINAKSALILVPLEFIGILPFNLKRFGHFGHKTPEFIVGLKEDSQFALLLDGIKSC